MGRALSRTTRALLDAIRENERGSYQEWATACGFRSTAVVQYHLNKLEADGLIRRKPGRARSVEIVKELPPCTE